MANRACALGKPWFLGAVTLLAVNDHVWKADHPGLVTGKISDVAGLVVVATLATTLIGRRRGLAAVAAGFVALKTVPGVAEAAAPLLGGTTRRDLTDLIALLALIPLGVVLGRDGTPPDLTAEPTLPDVHEAGLTVNGAGRPRPARPHHWRAVASSVLPILGAVTALVATTATSCDPDPAVTRVLARGTTFYAYVDGGFGSNDWARSDDGGRSWRRSPAPPGVDPDAPAGIPTTSTTTTSTTTTTEPSGPGVTTEPGLTDTTTSTTTEPATTGPYADTPIGPLDACGTTICYRVVDGRTIQRAPVSTDGWRDELTMSTAEVGAVNTGCSGGQKGVLSSVAVTDDGAVVSLGAVGVVARDADGTWHRHRVLDADQGASETGLLRSVAFWSVLGALPLGLVGAWVAGRRGSTLRIVGMTVVPVGVVAVIGWTVTGAILTGDPPGFDRAEVIAALVVAVLGVGLSMLSHTRPERPDVRPPPPERRRLNPPS